MQDVIKSIEYFDAQNVIHQPKCQELMFMKPIIKPKLRYKGSEQETQQEKSIKNFEFNIFKFNDRPKPNKKNILIVSCFSEFGCETVGVMYCLPHIIRMNPGAYIIVVGWYGREYFYRHLVDEFWEMPEEHQWLREYTRAFHHESKNLASIEKYLETQGRVMTSRSLGDFAVGSKCYSCSAFFGSIKRHEECPYCKRVGSLQNSMFADIEGWRNKVVRLPIPSKNKMNFAKDIISSGVVNNGKFIGVFARSRKTYGRNLNADFYNKLCDLLISKGYDIIWLGEKESTLKCPRDDIFDFSRSPLARDLEQTLAIIKLCSFTIQFWTASTRLASIMGVPYLLFESPEQIWGNNGQEGYRRKLCDFGPSKLSINHFELVRKNPNKGIEVVNRCINSMENNDFEDDFGLLETDYMAKIMKFNKERNS